MEVVGSEMAQVPVEKVVELDMHEKENGNAVVEGEAADVADSKFPKDAVDEWPAQRQIHSFYFVRWRPFEDPKLKPKLQQLDQEIEKCNNARTRISKELNAKRSERKEIMEQIRTLRGENDQYKTIFDEKRKELEPFQQALGKLRTNNTTRGGICSSEEELNDLIRGMQYHIQHESISLTEEKQILREIKQLEATREKVVINSAMRAKIQESLGQKEAIQDQVKLMGADLDGVRKEQQSVWARITQLREKVKVLDAEITPLMDEITAVIDKKDKAWDNIRSLRKLRDDGNSDYTNSRHAMSQAKMHADQKNVKALEELSHNEVENFMSQWNSNKKFRDDYEKRILPSLDGRQLSRDGRMRNPDEKPLVAMETPVPSAPEPVAKANAKKTKEPAAEKESLPAQMVKKESNKKDLKPNLEDVGDEISWSETQHKNPPPAEKIDEAKLKELKRAEELEKSKLAMERKKKLAEKNANKAAIRAKKEEEKKLKDKEKRLKKKNPASEPLEPAEQVAEVVETEKLEVQDEPAAPVKEKVRKENPARIRNRGRGADSLPKAMLRKKKSSNYWMWAGAAAAVLLLLVALAVGYYYSSPKPQFSA